MHFSFSASIPIYNGFDYKIHSQKRREEQSRLGCKCVDPVVGGGHLSVRRKRNVARLEAAYGND